MFSLDYSDIREFEKAESQRRVPVVAISGSVQQAERDSYFQAGMDGFLGKPLLSSLLLFL